MSVRKQREESKQGAPEWVVTFGDMMCLLMCFFVLLLSFSTLESERFKVVAGFIRKAFGVQFEHRHTNVPAGETLLSQEFEKRASNSAAVSLGQAKKIVEEMQLDSFVKTDIKDDAVRFTLKGSFAYAPGSAELRPEAQQLVREAARMVLQWGARVEVCGHTDSQPLRSERYASNWELSAARATAVVRTFQDAEVPGARLQALAFADTRPIADNLSEEGRNRNRRVEILIYPQ